MEMQISRILSWVSEERKMPNDLRVVPGACQLVIQNKADYHYEIIESAAIKYPLPWETFNCTYKGSDDNKTQPIIMVDVALAQSHKWGPEGSREGFVDYFYKHLQNKTTQRDDGVWLRYRDLVDYRNYTTAYSALVETSCDTYQYLPKLRQNDRMYCVVHGVREKCEWPQNRKICERTCQLNPMHPKCFFIPSVLPKFDDAVLQKNNSAVTICALGQKRNHDLLAGALHSMQNDGELKEDDNIGVVVRVLNRWAEKDIMKYTIRNLKIPVEARSSPGYWEFQRDAAQCDILLPLIDSTTHPEYFPVENSKKKLSGVMSQIISYEMPSVMHHDLLQIYGDHMKPSHRQKVYGYASDEEFKNELQRLIQSIKQEKREMITGTVQ